MAKINSGLSRFVRGGIGVLVSSLRTVFVHSPRKTSGARFRNMNCRGGRIRNAYMSLPLLFTVTFGTTTFAAEKDEPLNLPLVPAARKGGLLLTSALSDVGSRIKGGYVVFGVELNLKKGKEPIVALPRPDAADLGTALRDILRQLPNYEMRVVSKHFIEISPRGARTDPTNLLNLAVANFDVTNISAGTVLSNPKRFVPELEDRLNPKPPGGVQGPQPGGGAFSLGARITLHLQGVSVREILNRVSEETERLSSNEHPLGWVYKLNSDSTPGIPMHSWQVLSGSPSDWHEYRDKGKLNK